MRPSDSQLRLSMEVSMEEFEAGRRGSALGGEVDGVLGWVGGSGKLRGAYLGQTLGCLAASAY